MKALIFWKTGLELGQEYWSRQFSGLLDVPDITASVDENSGEKANNVNVTA